MSLSVLALEVLLHPSSIAALSVASLDSWDNVLEGSLCLIEVLLSQNNCLGNLMLSEAVHTF